MQNPVLHLEQHLSRRKPRKIWGRQNLTRAAVSIVISQQSPPSLLMIRRAQRKGDPWSGDMAFPGGKVQADDHNAFAAAVRETREEAGLDLEQIARPAGRLNDLLTRRHDKPTPMVVTPYVFLLETPVTPTLNWEATHALWIPLAHFYSKTNRKQMNWRIGPVKVPTACYHYDNCRIWGLSLLMIDELVKLTRGGLRY